MCNTYYYYTITNFLIRPRNTNPTPLVYFFFLFISSFLFSLLSVFVILLPFLLSSFHCHFLRTSRIYCTNSTEDYGISIQFNLMHNKIS